MSKQVTFISYAPFLSVGCRNFYEAPDKVDGDMILSKSIQFVDHRYTTSDPFEVEGLRGFAEKYKQQHIVVEADKGISLEHLISLRTIYEAEEDKKAETLRQEHIKKEQDYAEWRKFAKILKSRF